MSKERVGLKVLRVKHQMTQQEIANKLGVSVATYNLVENGKRQGSNDLWLDIQALFNLDGGQVWDLKNPKGV